MNKPVEIVVLSRYWDIFKSFLESSELHAADYKKILVKDSESDIPAEILGGRWTVVEGLKPFSMAGNGNVGLKATSPDVDVLYVGDDVKFLQKDTIAKLQEIAYKDSAIGILTPRIIGRGSPTQVTPMAEILDVPPLEMWFPCIYIKRELIDKIGYLDEQFNNFGCDDLDYCLRAKQAGYRLCVTSKVAVKHEASPEGGPTTFIKKLGLEPWQEQQTQSLGKLIKKYDVAPAILDKVIKGADISLLSVKPTEFQKRVSAGERPSNDECKDFLKTRWIFIGTPCYGGMMTVNYTNSLLSLTNMCHDLGIKYTVSFMHNESLITRARNKIADEFLSETEATDFFWIDSDIGFDARDIVTLIMQDEGIIAFPCVRKNLRIDRVVSSVKKEFGQELSTFIDQQNGSLKSSTIKDFITENQSKNGHDIEYLEKMMGEFVLNFIPNKVPDQINLGQLTEVLDAGTGLMRIKREAFETIKGKFSDRWVYPLMGEAGTSTKRPLYMFFQAEPDYTVPGQEYPDYISEDYSFCRLARRAGLRVWVAPWCKTTHAGTYLFSGDMEVVARNGGVLR